MASALREWMKAKGMSQAELERLSGVSDFTIRRVLAGTENNYRADRLAKICLALGQPADALERVRDGVTLEAQPALDAEGFERRQRQ